MYATYFIFLINTKYVFKQFYLNDLNKFEVNDIFETQIHFLLIFNM